MRQPNSTIFIYPTHDLLRGRVFAVALKGINGDVEQFGPYAAISRARLVSRNLRAKYGFEITTIECDTSYWVGKGGHADRGQYEIVASSYLEACNKAEVAGLGMYPVIGRRFDSFPVLGVL